MHDLQDLHEISCRTYRETFESSNTEENMKIYLDETYNTERLKAELAQKDSNFYFIYTDDRLSGYLKINDGSAQTDIFDPQGLEVERLYITGGAKRTGLGSALINLAVDIAAQRLKTFLWLGVWEFNFRAQAFYNKNGFYQIGAHPFIMGNDKQTDLIFRKDLT